MNWEELDDRIDDYLIGRRWNDQVCWVEGKRLSVNELTNIFNEL